MSYYHTPREDWPSRNEVEYEEAWLHWINTYDTRFTEWCATQGLDPESTASVIAYEKEWEE